MITAYPDYYNDFSCIASRCRHSCCIGWEIDIDPETDRLYKSLSGPLGEKLKKCIDRSAEPHFILGEHERCPFLNGDNLCEIILELGEGAISEICTEHPRFRTYLSERTEIGLGLCCEEAARIILNREKPFAIAEEGEGNYTPDEDYLMDLREEIFEIIFDENKPFTRRLEAMLSLCGAQLPDISFAAWGEFYEKLERLDEAWTDCLRILQEAERTEADNYMNSHGNLFPNLCAYFVYRHLFTAFDDGDIKSKLLFAALSCRIIAALCSASENTPEEYARMYSSEIEYSDENLGLIFDKLCE